MGPSRGLPCFCGQPAAALGRWFGRVRRALPKPNRQPDRHRGRRPHWRMHQLRCPSGQRWTYDDVAESMAIVPSPSDEASDVRIDCNPNKPKTAKADINITVTTTTHVSVVTALAGAWCVMPLRVGSNGTRARVLSHSLTCSHSHPWLSLPSGSSTTHHSTSVSPLPGTTSTAPATTAAPSNSTTVGPGTSPSGEQSDCSLALGRHAGAQPCSPSAGSPNTTTATVLPTTPHPTISPNGTNTTTAPPGNTTTAPPVNTTTAAPSNSTTPTVPGNGTTTTLSPTTPTGEGGLLRFPLFGPPCLFLDFTSLSLTVPLVRTGHLGLDHSSGVPTCL